MIAFRPAATRARPLAETYAAGLKAKLCITTDQAGAWSMFADALSCNRQRMASGSGNSVEPFGALADRLAARERIRHAGRALMDVLSAEQQHVAARALPLCCLASA
jgi:hypothetical protein